MKTSTPTTTTTTKKTKKTKKAKSENENGTRENRNNKSPPVTGGNALLAAGACVLGDSAFVERPWLRTPIPGPRTRGECYFNHRHGSRRRDAGAGAGADADDFPEFPIGARTPRASGRLKWLFGCLDHLLFSVDRSPPIVDACVVLYNFFLEHDGDTLERDGRGTYRFTDEIPTKKTGHGGRAQWERDCESDPPSARKAEMDYLANEGFLERDWGKEGARGARMF